MISFRTLKKPALKILEKDDENVELEISLTCKIQVVDHDLNNPQSYQENACNSFKVYLKDNSDALLVYFFSLNFIEFEFENSFF